MTWRLTTVAPAHGHIKRQLLLTAAVENYRATRAAGFDLHLVKPLQVNDLIKAIEDAHEATPSDVAPS